MQGIFVVCKANITVKHHFFVSDITSRVELINSLPLVIACGDTELRSPSFKKQGSIVVIIELALVWSITPVATETWVFNLGLSKSMCSRNGSNKSPCTSGTLRFVINVVQENVWETCASIISLGHKSSRSTIRGGIPTNFESIYESRSKRSSFKLFVGIIFRSSSNSDGFWGNNDKVSKRKVMTMIVINRLNSSSSQARSKSFIVSIIEVNTAIWASSFDSTIVSVIHKIMSSKSY